MADACELPDIAIFQILQSLSTKFAVQASILSKQWERVWPLVPILDFDEDENVYNAHKTSPGQHRNFLEFVTKCLKRREEDKLLHKFRLRIMYCHYCKDCEELMDKCLSFSLDRNVKELHIAKSGYFLSHKVLNAQCLTVLSLESIEIRDDDSVTLPSLKSLFLICVCFGDLGFLPFMAGCPSLENLSVVKCTGFEKRKRITVSSASLKSLEVFNLGVELQLEAMNLESIRFGQNCYSSKHKRLLCNIEFSSCRALRNLEFFQIWFVGAWFENLSSKFPLLESLILYECGIERGGDLNVSSHNLKHFVLGRCDSEMNVEVYTPNLHSFSFIGSRTITFRMFATKLSNATIILDKSTTWNTKPITLRDFLANFDCCGKLTIYAFDSEDVLFPEDTRQTCRAPLPSLKHLDVKIVKRKKSRSVPKAVTDCFMTDSLNWMAPALESLSINKIKRKWCTTFHKEINSCSFPPCNRWMMTF